MIAPANAIIKMNENKYFFVIANNIQKMIVKSRRVRNQRHA